MQSLLEDLGLTSYEARALDHIVRHGARSGPDVSAETGIPFGRIYDTLNSLVDKGLATVESGRPKRYTAVPPSSLPGRILALNRARIQHQQRSIETGVHRLEQEMQGLAPAPEPSRHAYGIRLGEESGREFLVQATHEADSDVVAFLAFDRIDDDDLALFDAFRSAVSRGLRTRLLLRGGDIDYLLSTPYVDEVLDALLPHLGTNLEVRLSWEDHQPFASIDGRRAMIGVKNPLDPTAYFAVIHVDDDAFATGLVARFDALWSEADEPRNLIQWAAGRKGGRALLRLGARMRGS